MDMEKRDEMSIGKQIRMYRLQKKVKQEELASYLGVSAQAVGSGGRKVSRCVAGILQQGRSL